MREEKIYIPCLRWKRGEYESLFKMPPLKKKPILPIFDVAEFFKDNPENAFDHEDKKSPKTVDQHLSKIMKRIAQNWGIDECLVDLRHIDPSCRLQDGLHPVKFVFNGLRYWQVAGIPVVGIDRDEAFRSAVRDVIKLDNRGFCFRANLTIAISSDFSKKIIALLEEMQEKPENVDFILDLGAPDEFEPFNDFTDTLEAVIQKIPFLSEWRLFGLIGHSIPASISKLPLGISTLPRNEWILYKKLRSRLIKLGIRIPIFGDYAINHPTASNFNNKAVPSTACVRYTIKDGWLISKGEIIYGKKGKNGEKVKVGAGYGQYNDLCDLIVKNKNYSGISFSYGDEFISKCANKKITPGNQSQIRDIGTSHHFEVVINDLSNLSAS